MKWRLHGEGFCPGWKPSPVSKTGLGFQPCSSQAGRLKVAYNRSKISARVETWVWAGALTEYSTKQNGGNGKLCLNPGWNSLCNHNKISARGAGWNFSPRLNSPCNYPLRKVSRETTTMIDRCVAVRFRLSPFLLAIKFIWFFLKKLNQRPPTFKQGYAFRKDYTDYTIKFFRWPMDWIAWRKWSLCKRLGSANFVASFVHRVLVSIYLVVYSI